MITENIFKNKATNIDMNDHLKTSFIPVFDHNKPVYERVELLNLMHPIIQPYMKKYITSRSILFSLQQNIESYLIIFALSKENDNLYASSITNSAKISSKRLDEIMYSLFSEEVLKTEEFAEFKSKLIASKNKAQSHFFTTEYNAIFKTIYNLIETRLKEDLRKLP